MRTQLTHARANSIRPLLTATLALAITFTLSCSNGDDNEGGGGGGNNNNQFAGNPEYEREKERLKYYDPDDADERCQNGVVEGRCEVDGREVWYNPLTHGCNYSEFCSSGMDGEMNCERTYYGFGTVEICGNQIYVSYLNGNRRCQGGILERKCGDDWYNRETHYCDWERDPNTGIETSTLKARERCGSKYYIPDEGYIRCQNGVVQERCGGWNQEEALWYNYETHYCSYNYDGSGSTYTIKAQERCGNQYINDDYERCNNEVVEYTCGGTLGENAKWYNEITQSCNWTGTGGTVKNKLRCGS
jgi:hypothetical protein